MRQLFFPAMTLLWLIQALLSIAHPEWFAPGASLVFMAATIVCSIISLFGFKYM